MGTNEEEKAAKKELTETEKLTQLIQSLSKKEEEQKAPEPDSSTDFVKFLNVTLYFMAYSNFLSIDVRAIPEIFEHKELPTCRES